MQPLDCLIDPGTDDAPVLLLLHGRGSDERDLLPLGRQLHDTATIISVRAPFPAAPWGYGPGWAWYRFIGGTTPEPESFTAGQDVLAAFVADLPTRLGRDVPTAFIGGFSQGGTTSLAFTLRNPGTVAGVMVFSGFIANHPTVTPSAAGTTPIWWGHGTADPAIPFEHAEAGWQSLAEAGAVLETLARPGMGHTIDATEVAAAREWLRAATPA
jgi:phospholipase/carboxylesterase